MNLHEIYNELNKYSDSMSLAPPATESNIVAFENDNSIQLPKPFIELLKLFNGGNIQISGIEIYGINREETKNFTYISQVNRKSLKLPENYYIIAKLNYGDYICLNFLPPHDVIQWDNTNKSKYLSWNSLESWLESLLNFGYTSIEKGNNQSNAYYNKSAGLIKKSNKKRIVIPIIFSVIPLFFIGNYFLQSKTSFIPEQSNNTTRPHVNPVQEQETSTTYPHVNLVQEQETSTTTTHPNPPLVVLSKSEIFLNVGDTDISFITSYPTGSSEVNEVWKSMDESIATVDYLGYITGIDQGETFVVLSFDNNPGIEIEIKVHVSNTAYGTTVTK